MYACVCLHAYYTSVKLIIIIFLYVSAYNNLRTEVWHLICFPNHHITFLKICSCKNLIVTSYATCDSGLLFVQFWCVKKKKLKLEAADGNDAHRIGSIPE